MIAIQESLRINLRSLFDVFLPVQSAWRAVVGNTLCGELSSIQFVSSCFSIIHQSFVTGWGGLRPPAALVSAPAIAFQTVSLSAKCDEEG